MHTINKKEGENYIFRAYITIKGRKIYAYEKGLKAFKIRVG